MKKLSGSSVKKDGFFVINGKMDIGFLTVVMILLTVGIVMMFSASYVNASYTEGDPYLYFKKQAIYAVVGIVFMLIVSTVNTKVVKKCSILLYIISIALLVLVLIVPYQIPGKEEFKRWLAIGPITFQPSEIAKLGVIVFCARVLTAKKKPMLFGRDCSLAVCFFAGIAVCGLIVFEKHLSCIILIFCLTIVMMILGGLNKKLITAGVLLAVTGIVLIFVFKDFIVAELPSGRVTDRIISWLDKDSATLSNRWQTNQSLYAIGSGGLFGLGLGNSKQKHLYMPEPQNDFIFSIVCEELGFIGAVIIILLFGVLIWRGFVIALNARTKYDALMVMGIVSHVAIQTILNILVVTDAVPNTGISLPFFSYGGTALIILLGEMGLILSVSRSSDLRSASKD